MGSLMSFKEYMLVQEAKIPDSIVQKYGKILFGTARRLPETDTEYEAKQWKAIFQYFKSYQNKADNIFRELLKLKKYYPVLKGDSQKTLYRGLRFGIYSDEFKKFSITKQILQHIKSGIYNDEKNIKDRKKHYGIEWFTLDKTYTYHPINLGESWSTKISSAKISSNIRGGYLMMGNVPHSERIFTAETSDKLKDKLDLMDEYEVVRVSKKPLKVKIHLSSKTFNGLKDML